MKKVLLSTLALSMIAAVNAQITSADFGAVGDVYILGSDGTPGVTIGAAGSGQTWNFTALNTESLDTVEFVDPTTLPNGADFPGSNLATVTNQGVAFLEKTTGYVRNLGFGASFGPYALSFNYNPGQDLLQFPVDFGDTYSTASSVSERIFIGIDTNLLGFCQITIDSLWIRRTSTMSVNVDGSGTINLPIGTFNNVLRAYSEDRSVDSIFIYAPTAINCPFPPISIPQGWSFADPSLIGFVQPGATNPMLDTTRIYTWYAPGEKFGVCAIDVNGAGQPQAAQFKSAFNVGINENEQVAVNVFPNPAKDYVVIAAGTSIEGSMIRIYDVQGKLVSTSLVNNNAVISTSSYVNGIYLYELTNSSSAVISRGKFVVSH